MTNDTREVLSALIDREPVDPDALARVLEDRDARALLVDFARLRQRFAEDDDVQPQNSQVAYARGGRLRSRVRYWQTVAAALLIVAAASGGFWLGSRGEAAEPPPASRVVQFTPGVDWKP